MLWYASLGRGTAKQHCCWLTSASIGLLAQCTATPATHTALTLSNQPAPSAAHHTGLGAGTLLP